MRVNESTRRMAFILQPSSVLSLSHAKSPNNPSANPRITSIAIDSASRKLFLGLSNGQVEEHEILSSQSTVTARKLSDRKVSLRSSSGAVIELCCIPSSSCLIARMEDGSVQIAPYDSAQLWPLPGIKYDATAMACDPPSSSLPCSPRISKGSRIGSRLAVSVSSLSLSSGGILNGLGLAASTNAHDPKPGIHETSKILVYSVGSGPGGLNPSGQSQPAHLLVKVHIPHPHVSMMRWVGDSIIAALDASGGYLLIRSGQQVSEIAMGVTTRTLAASGPSSARAGGEGILLFSDSILLLVDDQGQAVRQPLILPDQKPLSVVHAGRNVLVVMDGYFLVFDSHSCQMLQMISFDHDDPWIKSSGRMPVAHDEATGSVFVATSSSVRRLERVQEERQAWELLKSRRYSQALTLASSALSSVGHDPPWSDGGWPGRVIAQAGLMLLVLEGKADEALEAFASCPMSDWQPIQLLALFPDKCSKWMGLDEAMDSSSPSSLSKLISRPYWGLHLNGGLMPSLDSLCVSIDAPKNSLNHDLKLNNLKRKIAHYLITARNKKEVLFIELVDTLLVCLLCDTGEAKDLEALVSSRSKDETRPPCCAMLREAASAMEASRRWHALALFRSSRGQHQDALDSWRDLSEGKIHESSTASSGDNEIGKPIGVRSLAASSSSDLLCSQASSSSGTFLCSLTLCLTHLPWILKASPDCAIQILRKRIDITLTQGLALLSGGRTDDVRWLYLWTLVHEREDDSVEGLNQSARAMLHTELALELIECIQREHGAEDGGMDGAYAALEAHIDKLLQNTRMPWRPGKIHHTPAHPIAPILPASPPSSFHPPPPEAMLASIAYPSSLIPYFPISLDPNEETSLVMRRRMVRMRSALLAHLSSLPSLLDPTTVLKALGPLPQGTILNQEHHGGDENDQEDGFSSVTVSSSSSPPTYPQHLAQSLNVQSVNEKVHSGIIEGLPTLLMVRERVILLSRKGDHGSALRLLALHEQDLEASIAYCHRHNPRLSPSTKRSPQDPDLWLILLDVLLRGGPEPKYSAAIRVLQEEGGSLSPMQVLSTLPDSMPLHLASGTLMALLEGAMHRKRMAQAMRGLRRALNLTARSERATEQAQSLIVDDSKVCFSCHRLLLDKVVICYPRAGGQALCAKCGSLDNYNSSNKREHA